MKYNIFQSLLGIVVNLDFIIKMVFYFIIFRIDLLINILIFSDYGIIF